MGKVVERVTFDAVSQFSRKKVAAYARAIPGPGPSQNSALSGTRAPKVPAPFSLKE